MVTLLLKNADIIVTMDDDRRRISDGSIYVGDNIIEAVGPAHDLPDHADRVIDAAGMLLMPGLVNAHHHLYQTLTRAVPGAQDAELFTWLKTPFRADQAQGDRPEIAADRGGDT